MKTSLNILTIGDIMGRPGRTVLANKLQGLIDRYRVDVVIANGENAAGGRSITPPIVKDFLSMGIDVITSGNHIWDNKDVYSIIDEQPALLRPANYPDGVRGKGYTVLSRKGFTLCVINLMGRVHMEPLNCPFRTFDDIYDKIRDSVDIILVDLHAEATSEKQAFGWYVDGRASAVFGTHTHVQTADETILDKGTGYISDLGMTGAFKSVIGMEIKGSIDKFLTQVRTRYTVASENPGINAVLFTIDKSGVTLNIERVNTI